MLLYSGWFVFSVKSVGGGPTASHFLSTAKKSNQKMPQSDEDWSRDNLFSLDSFIQYTLAAPTKTLFTRLSCSSISELAPSQHHCIAADFSKHNEATTNKFSRLLFILEHVKTVPNVRLLLLSSAWRSKKKTTKQKRRKNKAQKNSFYPKELLSEVWGSCWKSEG